MTLPDVDDELDEIVLELDDNPTTADDTDQEVADKKKVRGLKRLPFFALAVFGHTLWGLYAPLARFLQRSGHLPPLSLIFVVSACSCLVMLVFYGGIRQTPMRPIVTSKNLWMMSSLVFFRSVTNVYSTKFTRAVYVQLIGLFCPFVVALMTRIWLKDPLPPFTFPSVVLSLIGVLFMMSGDLHNGQVFTDLSWHDALGVGLQLVSVLFLSTFLIMVKRHANLDKHHVLVSQFFVVLLLTPPISLAAGEEWALWGDLSATNVALVCFFGFGVFTFGNVAQITAIQKLGSASVVATFLPWRLVSALVLSMILLDEHIENVWQGVGALIVFLTLAFYLFMQMWSKEKKPRTKLCCCCCPVGAENFDEAAEKPNVNAVPLLKMDELRSSTSSNGSVEQGDQVEIGEWKQ